MSCTDFAMRKLYFNGINGATGSYSLSPMTVDELAQHVIDGRHRLYQQIQHQSRGLDRQAGEDKLIALVELLTEASVTLLSAPPSSDHVWFETLASRLVNLFLDNVEEGGVDPVWITTVAKRLEYAPQATMRQLARWLLRGDLAAVIQWLLSQDEEDVVSLSRSLEHRVDQALVKIRQTYLGEGNASAWDEEGYLRPAWVASFCDALQQLPMAAVDALSSVDLLRAHTQTLDRALRTIAYQLVQTSRERGSEAYQRLVALSSQGAVRGGSSRDARAHTAGTDGLDAAWSVAVAQVRAALLAFEDVDLSRQKTPLREALSTWLGELRRDLTGQMGTVPWVDPRRLEQAGWGVIFPASMPDAQCQAIQQALTLLLAHRRDQAGACFQIYAGKDGYRPGDTARTFLQRAPRGVDSANPVDPESGVPYYLLLIGSPDEIPFSFQYQLDVQYAVGRLDFGADLKAYRNYAHNVVAAEEIHAVPSPQAVFFSVNHAGDVATDLSTQYLVAPLYQHFRRRTEGSSWQAINVASAYATKANLTRIMQLDPPPAFLFVASHGLEFDAHDVRQPAHQGALLCDEWSYEPGDVPPSVYFSVDDVTREMNFRGQIAFFFACHSAGTPQYDEYYRFDFKSRPRVLTETPFTAALPKAMLALQDRGALAVIGHIERAWSLSFLNDLSGHPVDAPLRKQAHIEVFAAMMDRLLEGHPVGSALDFFNMRYAAMATELTRVYERIENPPSLRDAYRLAELWTAHNDARGFVIIGDPAVRLHPKLLGDASTVTGLR